jgi:GNAT superfamily N-acetyltransferase
MSSPGFTIDELRIPSSVDDPGAAEFVEMVDVRNAIETAILGSDVMAHTTRELLPVFQVQEYVPRRLFVARIDGRIVARGILSWSTAHNTSVSRIVAEVLPEFRNHGIGTALFDHMEALARESGRTTCQTQATHTRPADGERVEALSGFGHLSTIDPGVRFMRKRRYQLEQIKRISFLNLPVEANKMQSLHRSAQIAAGDDYRVVGWTGRTPQRWIRDLALLKTRMSTDDPTAGLDVSEENWDESRVIDRDEKQAASGREMFTVVVEHVPTGRLVGLSELSIPGDRTGPARQEDTLVLSNHRGHRLGLLLKTANLLALASANPGSPLVYTFNAEENRPMLNINEMIGFRAVGCEGGWKKVLPTVHGQQDARGPLA